jgi:ribosomal protein S18 acetylase RimI-like enzyme
MVIRQYKADDKAEVIALFRLNTPQWFAVEEEADLNSYLEKDSENYFLMLDGKKLVGAGGFNLFKEDLLARISWDFFHPSCQKQGLGTELVKYRLTKLSEYSWIGKIVVRTSQHAFGFYEKHGFELKETIKDYWAEGMDLYYMEKRSKRSEGRG